MTKPHRIWIIASAALAALCFALLAFFTFSRYSFVHRPVLVVLFTIACVSLVVSLTARLWRKLRRRGAKAALAIVCVLVCIIGSYLGMVLTIMLQTRIHSVHVSPEGTNRVALVSADLFGEIVSAQIMTNPWFLRQPEDSLHSQFLMLGRNWRQVEATWLSEDLVRLQVLFEFEEEHPREDYIYVQF